MVGGIHFPDGSWRPVTILVLLSVRLFAGQQEAAKSGRLEMIKRRFSKLLHQFSLAIALGSFLCCLDLLFDRSCQKYRQSFLP